MNEEPAMTRRYTFAPNIEYIKIKRGELGVNMVVKDMEKHGYTLDLAHIKRSEWVPIAVRKQFLYSVRDVLGWGPDKIREMGR